MDGGLPLLSGQVTVKIVSSWTSHSEQVPRVHSLPALPSDLGLSELGPSCKEEQLVSFLEVWRALQSTLRRSLSTPLVWLLNQQLPLSDTSYLPENVGQEATHGKGVE